MKKIYALLCIMIMTCCLVLTGCGGLGSMPASDDIIVGNGEFVVQKGDYLYFANAYTGYSTLETISNKKGNVVEYGLYRVKLTNSNYKKIEYDENGQPKNVEKVVSKVVGFENSNFYIVGDFLYFSSPNIHKTSSNENKFDLVSIFRVKLDGTEYKELYTTQNSLNGDFAIYEMADRNYLVTVEGTKVFRQELTRKGLSNKTLLVDDLSSTILLDQIDYESDKLLYYTANKNEIDANVGVSGNILKYVNLQNGTVETVMNNVGEVVTLVAREHGLLFYTLQTPTQNAYYYVKDFSNADKCVVYLTALTNFMFMGKNDLNQKMPIIYTNQSKLVIQEINSIEPSVLVNAEVTPIFTYGDYVYYINSTSLCRISYKDKIEVSICDLGEYQASTFDFDGRYIYYFAQAQGNTTGTKYLHRIDTFEIENKSEISAKPVGFVLESDISNDEIDEIAE